MRMKPCRSRRRILSSHSVCGVGADQDEQRVRWHRFGVCGGVVMKGEVFQSPVPPPSTTRVLGRTRMLGAARTSSDQIVRHLLFQGRSADQHGDPSAYAARWIAAWPAEFGPDEVDVGAGHRWRLADGCAVEDAAPVSASRARMSSRR